MRNAYIKFQLYYEHRPTDIIMNLRIIKTDARV